MERTESQLSSLARSRIGKRLEESIFFPVSQYSLWTLFETLQSTTYMNVSCSSHLSNVIDTSDTVDPKSVKDPKDLPYMQRPGGSADDSDLKKGGAGGFFNFGKKKKAPEPEPEPPKKNFWTF